MYTLTMRYWILLNFKNSLKFMNIAEFWTSRYGHLYGAAAAGRCQGAVALPVGASDCHPLQSTSRATPTTKLRSANAQFTPPARHDNAVLSVSCLVCRCEWDDCPKRDQTLDFLSATVLSCRESCSHRRSGRDTDKIVLWRGGVN